MHQRTDSWPSWRLRSRVAVGSLGEYCVGGGINAGASAGTIGEIGTFFGRRLRGPAGEWARNIYPVAVLLGMFMQLQASLPAKPWTGKRGRKKRRIHALTKAGSPIPISE